MPARTTQADQIAALAAQVAALTELLTAQPKATAKAEVPTRRSTMRSGRTQLPRDPGAPTRADRSRGYFLVGNVFLEAVRNKADTRTYLVGFERKVRQSGSPYLAEVYHRDTETRTPTYDFDALVAAARDPKVKGTKSLTTEQGEQTKAHLLAA